MIVKIDDKKFDIWFSKQPPDIQEIIKEGLIFFLVKKNEEKGMLSSAT